MSLAKHSRVTFAEVRARHLPVRMHPILKVGRVLAHERVASTCRGRERPTRRTAVGVPLLSTHFAACCAMVLRALLMWSAARCVGLQQVGHPSRLEAAQLAGEQQLRLEGRAPRLARVSSGGVGLLARSLGGLARSTSLNVAVLHSSTNTSWHFARCSIARVGGVDCGIAYCANRVIIYIHACI